MDVQAGDTGVRPDPSATAVVPTTGGAGQGRLFHDSHANSSFDDTDEFPVVPGSSGRGRRARRGAGRPGAPRWLRLTVVVVVLVILAAGAALGLVKSGVWNTNGGPAGTASQTTTTTPHRTPVTTASLLTATGTASGGTQSYTIDQHAFVVTVATSVGRSWVSIGVVGQRPLYAGILAPNSSQHETLLGPAQVDVGAGGTKVTISAGRHSQTLTPPSAPFNYQITPS